MPGSLSWWLVHSGNMTGMPFEGMSLMGYDNAKKIFTNTWVDNFGTGTITMEGTWDDKTKSITLKGKGIDPMSGKPVQVARHLRDRKLQRALMQFFKPENYFEVREALIQAGRQDLIGSGCHSLILAQPPKEAR